MDFVAPFFAGMLICNCVPHLASGLQGSPFPTPFATPRGVGLSSPLLNFIWGLFNLLAGAVLVSYWPVPTGLNGRTFAFLLGVVALGAYTSVHFGRVRAAREPGR
jgi:hypothetical protein